jgi:hypothetical protein
MFLFANIASHNMLKFDWGLGGITFHPVLDVDVILDFEIDLVFSLGLELQGTRNPSVMRCVYLFSIVSAHSVVSLQWERMVSARNHRFCPWLRVTKLQRRRRSLFVADLARSLSLSLITPSDPRCRCLVWYHFPSK